MEKLKMTEFMQKHAERCGLRVLGEKYSGVSKCRYCGKEFEFVIDSPFNKPHYCSDKCVEDERENYLEKSICLLCGKGFEFDKRITSPNYCSDECTDKASAEYSIKALLPKKYRNIETSKIDLLSDCLSAKKGLFLWGGPGTGKSTFAASYMKQILRNKVRAKWISFSDFIIKLQSSFKRSEETAYELVDSIGSYDGVIIIDDLGTSKPTEFVKQTIYCILNTREEKELKTIITSNFSLSEIDQQIDTRVSSRIAGMCQVIKFSGEDMRLK